MNKKFLNILLALFAGVTVFAQNDADVYLPSQQYNYSTARVQAMGGAFGALGGDLGAVSINPASIGVFRSSSMSFSTAVGLNNTTSFYLGNRNSDHRMNFNIGNIGYVGAYVSESNSGLVAANWSIGYNRLNEYHQYSIVSTPDAVGSLTDEFADFANNGLYDDAYEYQAEQNHLIWQDSLNNDAYTNAFRYLGIPYGHHLDFEERIRGRIGEYFFGGGVNIGHVLFAGASVNIQDYVYEKETTNYEQTRADEYPSGDYPLDYFENFYFRQYNYTRGTGVNLKLGLIFRPISIIRIGASVHTPTRYWMTQEFHTTMTSQFYTADADGNRSYNSQSSLYVNEYVVTTPFRAVGSLGFQIAKFALLDVDYEYIDYTSMRLRSTGYSGIDSRRVNDEIENVYQATHNLRGGAEFRIGKLSLRGGAGVYTNPIKSQASDETTVEVEGESFDINRVQFSGGFGWRGDSWYFDMAGLVNMYKYEVYPYADSPQADMYSDTYRLTATIGFRF